jgi:hypothetical protein
MRYFLVVIIFLLPNFVYAACTASGATVIYVNGVFTSNTEAGDDTITLAKKYFLKTGDNSVNFYNGYNPSHLAGLGDITQTVAQMEGVSISDYDLNTILLQIYPEVTTRKLLLVGHSQGSFFANALYDYLLAHGEPKASVGVYHVGSPASYVAGSGAYLTSSNDQVINEARKIAGQVEQGLIPLAAANSAPSRPVPLPANITLGAGSGNGHGFSDVYLAEAPDRVVSDIQTALQRLRAISASDKGDCFTPPAGGLSYQVQKAAFAVADPAATGVKVGAGLAQSALVAASNVMTATVVGAISIGKKVASDIGVTIGGVAGLSRAATPQKQSTNFDILQRLYGSSLNKSELEDLLGANQGSAVADAPVFDAPASQATPKPDVPAALPDTNPLFAGTGAPRRPPASDAGSTSIGDAAEPAPADDATTTDPVATTTDPVATTTEPEATSTPPEATSTEPAKDPFVIASQPDESHFCMDPDYQSWFFCYDGLVEDVDTGVGIYTKNLGNALSGTLGSTTVSKDPNNTLDLFYPWRITINCYTDAAYTQACSQASVSALALNSIDGQHWWADFSGSPMAFDPANYYQLVIDDRGFGTGIYGSLSEPYYLISAAP